MKNIKELIMISLAICLMLNPMMVFAEKDLGGLYVQFSGEIKEVNKYKENVGILVEGKVQDREDTIVFHLSDKVILLSDDTMEHVEVDELEVGMKVSIYYGENTPVALSLPPQLTPDVVVINDSEDPVNVHVSNFNEELISRDNMLKILSNEETIIVNEDGEEQGVEDIANRDLIVFYGVSTRSIPAQTNPYKIIVMDEEQELKELSMDQIIILDEEVSLDNHIYLNEEGTIMIPLRQVAEALGYEITWEQETKTAELTKGPHWTAVTIGEDNYNFAKMKIELGTAPELTDGKTYVPLNFIDEVLKVDTEISSDGVINILK